MNEIPEDVATQARIAISGWTIDDGTVFQFDQCAHSVARAILAERKRCAGLARSWEATARKLAEEEKDGERALYHHLAADMASNVASSIESGQ
ncbi:hypothetical protein [Mesorhizobium retamae]|uniref:Uncharacterized protein n=1 Tax=Mesorhizobium retamae TaxID=2912854 RepID=A0ABS9QJX2_9HYPH|nr:hypothetical protein [Mesorhizobium sp. IRAMC:0171]MCG7507036.1 hypothetical protein [Mesorhizobium sp. IRAMC:0171]